MGRNSASNRGAYSDQDIDGLGQYNDFQQLDHLDEMRGIKAKQRESQAERNKGIDEKMIDFYGVKRVVVPKESEQE